MEADDFRPNLSGWTRNNLNLYVKVFIVSTFLISSSSGHSLHSPSGAGEGWEAPPSPGQLLESPSPASLCSQCPPGYGVVNPCLTEANTLLNDTVCEPCPRGSFSHEFSAEKLCTLCSECPDGFYKRTPCMSMQDVRCRPCDGDSNGAFGNEDFLRKCEKVPVMPHPRLTPPWMEGGEDNTESSGEEGERQGSGELVFTTLKDIEVGGGEKEGGEGELPEELIPVNTKKPWDWMTEESMTTMDGGHDEDTTGDYNQTWSMEQAQGASGDSHQGSFQWPILLAAMAAAIVFFVVGVLISQCVKQTHSSPKKEPAHGYGEGMVETQLIGTENSYTRKAPPLPNGDDDVHQPIYTATPYDAVDSAPLENHATRSHGPSNLLRNKKKRESFYKSREMRYIDEDSDDEMVRHTGRPPSIFYKDRKKNKRKPRHRPSNSWLSKFRPNKQAYSTGSLENVNDIIIHDFSKEGKEETEPDYGTV